MAGNEKSGRAIIAREKQGDTGTYHYVDNLARAVRHVARQLVDMIPKIYDTQRIARIIGIDGEADMAMIDPTQQEPVKKIVDQETGAVIKKIYNPGVGKYDVCVTTGPSYMTKRQEAAESMAQILQGNPQLWAVAGDLLVKNLDWPGSDELAKRLKKMVDPKLLQDDNDMPPELMVAQQQMQAMGQELDQMHQMLQNVSKSMEARDIEIKEFDSKVKAYEAETRRISAVQASMSPEQIQDIVMGTIAAAIDTGDLIGEMPSQELLGENMQEMPQQPQQMAQPMEQQPMEPQQFQPMEPQQ
jgi:hypothetical protein